MLGIALCRDTAKRHMQVIGQIINTSEGLNESSFYRGVEGKL